jgi:hypothetical protein
MVVAVVASHADHGPATVQMMAAVFRRQYVRSLIVRHAPVCLSFGFFF